MKFMNPKAPIKKILVVGSSNTDMVIKTKHLPRAGETVLGGSFFMNPGGKGANQAVAIARLGGQVAFICKTGSDVFGHQSHQLFEEEGINISYVFSDAGTPSGVALITVDDNAENCIVVASGANANLSPNDIASVEEAIEEADFILMQLEIPLETVEYVAGKAYGKNKKVILNPAPARVLTKDLLQHLYLITPNETEAELLSGIKISDPYSACQAAKKITAQGVDNVVITLGAKGAFVYGGGVCEMVPACKVNAVDTTAAGDIFNGALTIALAENRSLIEAVRFACKAAAISVTRIGAQASAPYRNEVDVSNY
jgi:ribokinase